MPDVPPVQVTMDWASGVATVSVGGELDSLACAQLRDCLAWVGQNSPRQLVLDLDGIANRFVEQITLLAVARRQLPPGCQLDVRSADPAMGRILELADWTSVRVDAGPDQAESASTSTPG